MQKIILPVGENSHLHVKIFDKQDEGVYAYKLTTGSKIEFELKNSEGEIVQSTVVEITDLTQDYEIIIDESLPAGNYTYDLTVEESDGTKYTVIQDGKFKIK